MNITDHLLTGSVFLNIILGIWITIEYSVNWQSRFLSFSISLIVFFIGVQLPDFDHPKVQKGPFKLLKHFTRHRGHFHSLVAMSLYGLAIFALVWLLQLHFWYYPVIAGMLGFASHLIADDLNRWKLESKPTRAFKIW